MDTDDLNTAVEVRNPDIDAEAIMRRIRANIRQRRAQAEAQGLDYEAFVEGLMASRSATRFDTSLYYDLRRMSVAYDKIGVGLSLTESRQPLVGPLVHRLRRALHHLVIYYVNMLAQQQARINEYVVRALTTLTSNLEPGPTPAEVDALRQQVAQLQARLDALEAQARRAG
jgi:hypothetical protein